MSAQMSDQWTAPVICHLHVARAMQSEIDPSVAIRDHRTAQRPQSMSAHMSDQWDAPGICHPNLASDLQAEIDPSAATQDHRTAQRLQHMTAQMPDPCRPNFAGDLSSMPRAHQGNARGPDTHEPGCVMTDHRTAQRPHAVHVGPDVGPMGRSTNRVRKV